MITTLAQHKKYIKFLQGSSSNKRGCKQSQSLNRTYSCDGSTGSSSHSSSQSSPHHLSSPYYISSPSRVDAVIIPGISNLYQNIDLMKKVNIEKAFWLFIGIF